MPISRSRISIPRRGALRFAAAMLSMLGLLVTGLVTAPAAFADTIVEHAVVTKGALTLLNQ